MLKSVVADAHTMHGETVRRRVAGVLYTWWEEEGGSQTSKELNAEIHVTRVELFPLEKN